jgi:predicted AAA+ superfamily ATPase
MQTLPKRIYSSCIFKDLQKKMVFLGGPRQIGKTTLACSFLKDYHAGHKAYLNWDNEIDRRVINNQTWDKEEPIIIFDEVHKRKNWQTLIKGIYDTWKTTQKFIITGSARLDHYRKGGDSMLGRYHYHRIHPYSLNELGNSRDSLNKLFNFGGFPEPLLEEDEVQLRRWHLQRISKLIRQDLRDLENIQNLDKVEMLADILPSRVGSLLSVKSISEDLEISDKTIKNWISVLDRLYYSYQIYPYGSVKIKAIKKTPKIYLWDWSQVQNEAARFENLVASHLLKLCHYWEDTLGYKSEVRFIRDNSGRECDFVVIRDKKPLFAVECKLNSSEVDTSVIYFKEKLKIPKWYQVHLGEESRVIAPDYKILPFEKFCLEEDLV